MTSTQSASGTGTLTISQASEATGTPVETLRYYERAGVLPSVDRSPAGRRRYTPDDLGWITFVRRLRATGMTIQRIATYGNLVRAGEGTMADRRSLLAKHREDVAAAIDELTETLAVLDRKLAHYEAAEQGIDLDCSEEPLRHTPRLT